MHNRRAPSRRVHHHRRRPRAPEVRKLQHRVVLRQQHVLRIQVPMHDVLRMQVRHAVHNLPRVMMRHFLAQRGRAAVLQMIQLRLQRRGHQVQLQNVDRAHLHKLPQAEHVRMVAAALQHDLPNRHNPDAGADVVLGMRFDPLQRHLLVRRLLHRAKHFALPAYAKQADNFVHLPKFQVLARFLLELLHVGANRRDRSFRHFARICVKKIDYADKLNFMCARSHRAKIKMFFFLKSRRPCEN